MLLLDAEAYYHALRPELQKILTENSITYHRFHAAEAWLALYPGVSLSRHFDPQALARQKMFTFPWQAVDIQFPKDKPAPFGFVWEMIWLWSPFLLVHCMLGPFKQEYF